MPASPPPAGCRASRALSSLALLTTRTLKHHARQFIRQFAWVAGLWTLIALCSGLADMAYLHLVGRSVPVAEVFRRPLIEH